MARKRRFSSKIVVASATAIILFTIAIFYLEWMNVQNMTDVQVPSELIISWYSFWTVELVSLATIKVAKVKNKYEASEEDTVV